ncbi:MAG TPA: hypothetical protein VK716_09940 [Terracidiphilus sp.]|nr:hypothetical protein [Terracidiphilus sp.]
MDRKQANGIVTIQVVDYRSLMIAWHLHSGSSSSADLRFSVAEPLTDLQFQRLPEALKASIESSEPSLEFLERMFHLPDPRD